MATYSFNGMDLRVVEIDGEPWFAAKDVCVAIAYQVKANGQVNTSGATRPLSPDEKATYPVSTLGGSQRVSVISESGLYKLVMRSDKKEAKQFQDWVTREVLPYIRKTGTYTMPGAKKTIEAPEAAEAKNVPPPL